jgi:AraC family transcriptional activator of tynA and feaB
MRTVMTTAAVPPKDRFGYWHDAVCRSYVRTQLLSEHKDDFDGEIQMLALANLSITDIRTSAMLARRSYSDTRYSAPDVAFLQILLKGESQVSQYEREASMRVGEMCLIDPRCPYDVNVSDTRHVVLAMPREELERRVGDIAPLAARAIPVGFGEGALAANFLRNLMTAEIADDAAAIARLAPQAVDVAALAITHGAPETVRRLSSPASVSRLRLHHAIENNVRSPSLRCDDVAGMAGISARYANVLLALEGTSLERLIFRRRLELCHAALADPAQMHRSIGEIAHEFGFVTDAHFARSFKEAYGLTAREHRRAAEAANLGR